MPITIHEQSGFVVVAVDGRLDFITAPEIATEIERLSLDDRAGIVVDLERVSFIDSSGIGMLVQLHHRLAGGPRRLVVANPPEQARLVLRITNLEQMIELADSVSSAVSAPAR